MSKIYKMHIVEVDEETGKEEEILNDEYSGFVLLADCANDKNKYAELWCHANLAETAMKLANSKKMQTCISLAQSMIRMKELMTEDMEDSLSEMISGGLQ